MDGNALVLYQYGKRREEEESRGGVSLVRLVVWYGVVWYHLSVQRV
jgi:hypothetical protein